MGLGNVPSAHHVSGSELLALFLQVPPEVHGIHLDQITRPLDRPVFGLSGRVRAVPTPFAHLHTHPSWFNKHTPFSSEGEDTAHSARRCVQALTFDQHRTHVRAAAKFRRLR